MAKKADFLYGLATGIGSLPHKNVASALELIKETLPFGPHWPQLPQRGKTETFVRQYLSPLLKLQMLDLQKGDPPYFCDEEDYWPEKIEKFYRLYLDSFEEGEQCGEALSFFSFPEETAAGFYKFLEQKWGSLSSKPRFIKGQISGPLTVGLQVNSAKKTAAFYQADLRDIINKTLVLNARNQVRALKKFSIPVLIFIDEPFLFSYGQSAYVSLSRKQIIASIAEVIQAINEEGAYSGVHCCSGVDWSIIFQLPLHVVSFDAYTYFESMLVYSDKLEVFLENGGCLSWGLVPTSGEDIAKEDAALLQQRFYRCVRRLSRRGVKPELLARRFMITPSCGVGTLSLEQSEKVYHLTSQLQKLLYKEAFG